MAGFKWHHQSPISLLFTRRMTGTYAVCNPPFCVVGRLMGRSYSLDVKRLPGADRDAWFKTIPLAALAKSICPPPTGDGTK